MSFLVPLLIGILSIILPGFFLALALLKKTGMPMFEIAVIGFIFGLIFPPTLIWIESYLIPYVHFFTFSNTLYNINVLVLTAIGILLSIQQGAIGRDTFKSTPFKGIDINKFTIKGEVERDYKKRVSGLRQTISDLNSDLRIVREHERQEQDLIDRHHQEIHTLTGIGAEEKKKIEEAHLEQEKKLFEEHEMEEKALIKSSTGVTEEEQKSEAMSYVWIILLVLMVISFATRMLSIGTAPTYFEFDPYFDMVSTQYILVHGYQLLFEHSAWPTLASGTIHRLQPLVPYLEAYWYNLAGPNTSSTTVNTTLLSLVSSYYPPITAALLVFVVFMFLYHEYGEYEGLIGAGLATMMPILVTTFIAGEQLVEPWGIFALFFFYACYVLAVHNPEEPRYAILSGIAFASNFLGAHYYTVPAAVLAVCIIFQGIIHVLRNEDTKDFFKMNIINLAVILVFFIFYNAYGATLTERTPSILGIPVIVSFPMLALLFVAIFEYVPKIVKERRMVAYLKLDVTTYAIWLGIITFVSVLLILLTPLGKPIQSYIALSTKFTTPSSPLFMTVQEYAPTGLNYNFGSQGFGFIGTSIAGLNIIVIAVMLIFTALELLAIITRNSRSSILAVSAVWPLAVAGLIEVKYLPHFGVGYIIAIGAILGELSIYYSKMGGAATGKRILFFTGIIIVVLEAIIPGYQLLTAAANPSCSAINNAGNSLGSVLYCNIVPQYWLSATTWMSQNVGPYGPRILSWWDYGDWINWFGNSNAVLRGDNSVATADYAAAAHYVLTSKDGVNASTLQQYMDGIQAKYILFDDQLVPKWGALDFLACVNINQTSEQYALAQGKQYNQPYALGTSGCEIKHDPAYLFIPISQNINNYCQLPGNSSDVSLHGFVVVGQAPTNQTYCVSVTALNSGQNVYLLNPNGTKSNAILTPAFFGGQTTISGQPYISFMLVYAPNGPNNTITNAPSAFYNSTFYKGFFLGKLPGFTLVYPSTFSGINFVNSTNRVVIFQSNNFTGSLPYVTPKPSWVHNNYSMPG